MDLWRDIQAKAASTYQAYAQIVDTFAIAPGLYGSAAYNDLLHRARSLQQRYLIIQRKMKRIEERGSI